jgi:prepilin-type N-terminal cleavage/methylation domain-containing protein
MTVRASHRRAGFTIAECLVAVTLLAVGLLGLAGTLLAVERLADGGARRATAAALAWSRAERLRGTACAARTGGTAVTAGLAETWTVTAASGITRIHDSIALPPENGRPVPPLSVTTAVPC